MKKFTKFAGLAALATVGSVFAAWQFGVGTSTVASNEVGVTVSIDQGVVTDGLSGVLTLTHDGSGNNNVVVKQSNKGEYSFVLVDEEEYKDKINIDYQPGVGEQVEKYNYTIEIVYDLYYGANKIDTYTYEHDYTLTTGNKITDSVDLATLNTGIATVLLSTLNAGIIDVETLEDWLNDATKPAFSIKVKGTIKYSTKESQ